MRSQGHLQALVRRCQSGEQAAFEELFRQFQPRLRYYIRRLGAAGNHTEDVLQDVWIKVVSKIASLRDRRAFVAWLYTIARREAYNTANIEDPLLQMTTEGMELVPDDHEPVFSDEDSIRIHAALERLKPLHREILTLCFLEDLSHSQIAEILGIRAGTVKSRVYYAKQSLRKELERDDG